MMSTTTFPGNLGKIILWGIFAFFGIGVGLYPGVYLLADGPTGILNSKSAELLQEALWNGAFYTHIVFGGIALMVGWPQFSVWLRRRNMRLHRQLGMVYTVTVMLSGTASVYLALHATGGWVPMFGFLGLGITWLTTTGLAFVYVKNGRIQAHQQMMFYSYAACFAAVALRMWLPLLITYFEGEFIPAYRIVSWLCWVPNLIVGHLLYLRAIRPKAKVA